jgi:hypothetical protein
MSPIWLDSRPWDSACCIVLTKSGATRPPLRCRRHREEWWAEWADRLCVALKIWVQLAVYHNGHVYVVAFFRTHNYIYEI